MKLFRVALALFASLLVVGAMPVPVPAGEPLPTEAHIYLRNESDAFVWVTAYESIDHGNAAGAWCVPPGKYDQHGLRTYVYEVRFEFSLAGCQHRPVLADLTYNAPSRNPMPYSAYKTAGKYHIGG